MIDGLPPLPLPLPTPAPGKPANAGDFAAWLGDPPPRTLPVPPAVADATPVLDPLASMLASASTPPVPVPVLPGVPVPAASLLASALPPPALPPTAPLPLEASPPPPALPPLVSAPAAVAGDADAATAAPLWQVAVHPADGIVELLSPWRLVAGGSLSQVGPGRSPHALTHLPPLPRAASAAAAVVATGGSPRLPGVPFTVVGGASSGPAIAAMPAPLRPSESAPAAEGLGAPPAQLASAAQWALRLLRWFEHRGDGATAWLRDYTATAENTAQLVADVREFARGEGLPLRRVVLNGRTLWSADTPSDTRGTHDAR